MIKPRSDIVVLRFFDRMIDHQTRRLSRMLHRQVQEKGRVRLLLSIETLRPAGGAASLLESLHFVRLHSDHIERVAIVGANQGEQTVLGLFSLFSGVDMRYFDRSDAALAVRWLNESSDV
ncbi:MAG: STAS/SEC14 domain-containing protein [Desulfobacterales bacterium]